MFIIRGNEVIDDRRRRGIFALYNAHTTTLCNIYLV